MSCAGSWSAHTGIVEAPHDRAVELGLVDGLRRADAVQLGRTVGGEHQHRHTRQVGLDHRRVEVRGGRAAGAQQRRRHAGRQRRCPSATKAADRSSWTTCTSMSSRAGQRQRHRRAARARRDHRVAHALAHPLVDERGAEGGLDIRAPAVMSPRYGPIIEHVRPPRRGRDLVRRRLPVVLHRQAAVRDGGRRSSSDEIDVDVVYRPYQLDPTASPGKAATGDRGVRQEVRRPRTGRSRSSTTSPRSPPTSGLEFRMDRALRANTLLAHRLLWLAEDHGPPVRAEGTAAAGVLRRRARRRRPRRAGRRAPPRSASTTIGSLAFLASDDGARRGARRSCGPPPRRRSPRVPTFVFDGRWMVPGAQDPDTFVQVLTPRRRQATPRMSDWRPLAGGSPGGRVAKGRGSSSCTASRRPANSWKPIAARVRRRRLRSRWSSILPGHGDTVNVRADLRRTADMLAAVGGRRPTSATASAGGPCLHAGADVPAPRPVGSP